MDRWLLVSLCCAAVLALGCQANRQAGLDPFNGRQRVPPPGTGAGGGSDPYLSGSAAAPGGAVTMAPGPAPTNPWPTGAATPPPAWGGTPSAAPQPSNWWPFGTNPNPQPTPPASGGWPTQPPGYPAPAYTPPGQPAGYPYRGTQTPPAAGVIPATYEAPPAGSTSGWRPATPQ
jgi:hypothetical protein